MAIPWIWVQKGVKWGGPWIWGHVENSAYGYPLARFPVWPIMRAPSTLHHAQYPGRLSGPQEGHNGYYALMSPRV